MEDIIQFLVIVGILFFSFRSRRKKREPMSEEVFPPITDYEAEDSELESTTAESYTSPVTPKETIYSGKQYTPVSAPKQQKTVRQTVSSVSAKPDNKRINLHTPQKAREAFIYSEIFNRKYK